MDSHAVLIAEITDLKAQLAEARKEAKHYEDVAQRATDEAIAIRTRLAASEAEVVSLRAKLKEEIEFGAIQVMNAQTAERKREEAERALGALRDSVQDVLRAGTEWSTDPSINGCLNSEQRLKDSLARLEAAILQEKKSQESKRTNG